MLRNYTFKHGVYAWEAQKKGPTRPGFPFINQWDSELVVCDQNVLSLRHVVVYWHFVFCVAFLMEN